MTASDGYGAELKDSDGGSPQELPSREVNHGRVRLTVISGRNYTDLLSNGHTRTHCHPLSLGPGDGFVGGAG